MANKEKIAELNDEEIEHCHENNHEHSHEHNHGHNHEHNHEHGHEHGKEAESPVRLIVAAVLLVAALVAEKIGAFEDLKSNIPILLAFLIPYAIAGYETIIGAVRNIFHGEIFDEEFLMLIASVAAFAIGEYAEAAAVMLLFETGEMLEDYAVDKSRDSISDLMNIVPEYANVFDNDGHTEQMDPSEVKAGSMILIKPGERVPLDAVVTEGEGFIDTAALTGESVPKKVSAGDDIYSGCINGSRTLVCRTVKEYSDSTVSRILELVENAEEKKSKTENFITRFARYYTPAVTITAVMLAVIPSLITGNWSEWIRRACTFLVISCPCALVISVPLGFFAGIGAASKAGILVKGSNYLEAVSKLKIIAFDKTGTLTRGEFKVNKMIPESNEMLALAAALERASSHPIAQSIVRADNEKNGESKFGFRAERIKETAGCGIEGIVNGERILAGNSKLMSLYGIDHEEVKDYGTITYVARGNAYLGAIVISDSIKSGIKDILEQMREAGVAKTVMLTGDSEQTAAAVASEVGVSEFHASLLPQDKVLKVEELLEQLKRNKNSVNTASKASDMESISRGTLAFVGDGINDAPVLMRADIGIAMGSLGSDSAIEAADVVIMDDDISKIPTVIRIARKTLRVVKQNIAFTLGVKFIILALGAFGIAGMWLAVFADVGVAMIAILNSMRAMK